MDNKIQELIKPPIKEVIIGISYDGLFTDLEDIITLFESSSLNSNYDKTEEVKTVSFEMGSAPKLSKNISVGYVFKNKINDELIHIQLDKLMFIDRNNYTTFDNFIQKFIFIITEILKYKNNFDVKDIGLRYVNSFLFSNEKYKNNFKIKPTISLDDGVCFAKQINSLNITNVSSNTNINMFASVKTIIETANDASKNIIFDIDTHLQKKYTINNAENFYNEVLQLKEFKNKIFFSNFVDIYNIEEFQNGC